MSKVKIPRKSTFIDMTAMCDVAFLLLSFFMLTTKFKPDEAVVVDIPSSISEIKLPDADILTITINKEGTVYFGIDGKYDRQELIKKIGNKYKVEFTESEIYNFSIISSFGIPISGMKQFLSMEPSEREKIKQPGIPCDSLNNELADWIIYARLSNPKFRIAVKGDKGSNYPVIHKVISTLQDKKINKFNLITTLEGRPEM